VPQDFGLLHLHLLFLLDLLDLDEFGDHLLLHDVGLQFVGLVGLRLLAARLLGVLRFLDGKVALRLGLLAQRSGLRDDAILVGRGLGDGGLAQRVGAANRGVALGFGRGYLRIALDPRDIGPSHVGDVFVLVAHLANGEADDLKAHLRHVVHAGGAHALGDHLRLLDDLFDGQLADDAAQMAFHHKADEAFALVGRLRQKLLGGGKDRLVIRAHLDLRDCLDRHGHALLGVEILLRRDVKAHQLQRELAIGFNDGEYDRAATLDDARVTKSIDDNCLVRSCLAKHSGESDKQCKGCDDDESDDNADRGLHGLSFCSAG